MTLTSRPSRTPIRLITALAATGLTLTACSTDPNNSNSAGESNTGSAEVA